MKREERPKFFVLNKDFNTGQLEKVDVLNNFFNVILTKTGRFNKKEFKYIGPEYKSYPVTTKEQLSSLLVSHFRYNYWAKCECEFLICDWPNREKVDDSRPIKIDMFDQIKINYSLILDLVWNYLEPKINK